MTNDQGWPRVEQLWRDVVYGLRQIRRNPGFSAVAITTLALGIGVNTAMFSAVDAVLIRPMPYHDSDRLVMIWDVVAHTGELKIMPTPPEWREWRRRNAVFTDIAATQPGSAALSSDDGPEQLPARKVTANFWSVLGVRPLAGRAFTEDEAAKGTSVVVISYGLWQRRFGGSPDAIGRTIILNDIPHEIVGVMPREFYFLPARDIDVWMPTAFSGLINNWGWHDLNCVARLKPGVTLTQAGQAMAALHLAVSAEVVKPARSALVTSLREEIAGKTRASLIVLLAGSGAILLIACVNLANLLMARAVTRRREVAMRAALGASRARLMAQLLIESLVLSGIGALFGLLIALPVMRFLERIVPETMGAVRLTLDWRVLLFSAGVALATGVLFGLAPAVGGSRAGLAQGLRDGARGSAGGRSYWFQHSLIVAETALAVVLLTAGGLLLQTFQQLRTVDLGLRSERLLTFVTPLFRYRDFDARVAFVNSELERVRAIPGVTGAAAISRIPLTVTDQATFYLLDGQTSVQARDQVALTRVVTREYFTTVGARLREGRFFDATDVRSQSPAAVVNESFANRNYPGRSPLGARFKFGRLGEKGYWYTVVGVVKDIRERGVAEEVKSAVYRLHEQADQTNDQPSGIVVRTAVPPESIVSAVRDAIWSLDRRQPIARLQTMDAIVEQQLSGASQSSALLGAFALLALGLASIGLYGVLSYAVSQRTREIGVRMALGATSKNILVSFGRRGLALTLAGLAIGIGLALVAARLMTTLFYGFEPGVFTSVVVASVVLLGVAAVASLVPARRASQIEPTIALQHE